MAVGRVIENPISGERIIIRQSGAETGGELLTFDLYLPPGAHVPARHTHPIQQERFTIVSGQMRFRLGHRSLIAHPGDAIVVPAKTAHWFGNESAEVAHALVEVRPALRMEELFETTEAAGKAAHARGVASVRVADLASIVLEFQREVAIPNVPALLVRVFLAPLAWLGRHRAQAASRIGGA